MTETLLRYTVYRNGMYGRYRDSNSIAPKGRKPTPGRTLTVPMKISTELKEILDSEKTEEERYNDTILRLLKQRAKRVGELQKKVDALEQERQLVYVEVPNKIQ